MLFCSTLPCPNLLPGLPIHRVGKRQGAIEGKENWRGWIHILPLICSEKCPAQRTLTPINPATGCYRCSGRHQNCVYVCVYVREALWCGGRRHFGAQCRVEAPAQSIGSLSPPPRLGCRQVHFRATGQIDSSAFIFFRLRSGSCSEAGGRSYKKVRNRDWREGRGKKERVRDRVRWRREASRERGVPGFVPHPCPISLFLLLLLLLALSLYSTTNTSLPWNHYQDMHSLPHQVPSWKLAQGQASRFTTERANGFLLLFWRVPVYPLCLLIIHYS